jgi:UDP-N-acetylglucosamine acyltransferase
LKYAGEPTRLEIGDRNTIRECVTINRGTVSGGGLTSVGSDNLLMAYIHIAHDCRIGSHVIFSNNASLAGHAHVGNYVILSGFTLVHQFCSIGDYAFTGMGSAIAKDVPPYLMISGNPAAPHGLNKVGLKRRGFSEEQVRNLTRVYKILYRQGLSLDEAKQQIQEMAEGHEEVKRFADFLEASKRSIIR